MKGAGTARSADEAAVIRIWFRAKRVNDEDGKINSDSDNEG